MLEIRGVSVNAGDFCLRDISFVVKGFTTHVIIGPTGSGKTTFLETIIGLRMPDRGKILLDGMDIIDIPVEKRGFSYLPQDLCLFPHLTVKDNILYGLNMKGIKDKGFVDSLIDTLRISHLMERKITNLSGGEKQRVALARALAGGNRYLLLDEPLSSLHAGLKRELWYLLKRLNETYKLTTIMVTHDIEEASFLADTMSVMIDGRIHQTDTGSNIYRYPDDIEVANFFGINNLFNAEIEKIEDGIMYTKCQELNTTLALPITSRTGTYKTGDQIIAGIRAEDVLILRHEYIRDGQENLLKGEITGIYEKGSGYIVLFSPSIAKKTIEIDVPDYAFRKLKVRKGSSVSITLKYENIFLIKKK